MISGVVRCESCSYEQLLVGALPVSPVDGRRCERCGDQLGLFEAGSGR